MSILINSMKTWGELGNWLSGQSLSKLLNYYYPGQLTQISGEEWYPYFGQVGKTIRQLTKLNQTPQERFEDYRQTLYDFDQKLQNVLIGASPFSEEWETIKTNLDKIIDQYQPQIIVGTKGVICRVWLAYLHERKLNIPVVNYITNHGHFQFAVHHCPRAARHIIRLSEGVDYIRSLNVFPSEKLLSTGYLVTPHSFMKAKNIASVNLQKTFFDEGDQRMHLIILSNRGNAKYLEILLEAGRNKEQLHVTFIGLKDPEICSQAQQIIDQFGVDDWQVLEYLDQKDFLAIFQSLKNRQALFISKASPNAIFESVYFEMPMMMVRSGLPMEDWACDVVEKHGFGIVFPDIEQLVAKLSTFLKNPEELALFKKATVDYKSKYLDQQQIAENIKSVIEELRDVNFL